MTIAFDVVLVCLGVPAVFSSAYLLIATLLSARLRIPPPSSRNLRFALPASVRSQLPPGSKATLSLSIATRPQGDGCSSATPTTSAKKLSVKVVKVLADAQAGVS